MAAGQIGTSVSNSPSPRQAVIVPRRSRRRRMILALAILASLVLHLMVTVPLLVPGSLFAAKAPPPEPIAVEIVSLPPKPEEQAKPPEPPPPQQTPEPPPKPVQLPPPQPPPPVTPQQIVVATREEATPPQGDEKTNAAPEKPEPEAKPQPMPPKPPIKPEAAKPEPPKPAPPKPEPPKAEQAKPEPPPEREVTGAIALGRPAAKAPDQITAADHKLPPVVVRPLPPGRRGSSLMPSYPSAARANGLQGRVVLLVTLSVDGRPRRIDIARSSGHDQLDESAVRAVWLWRFYRTDNGPPMEATIEIPLDFRL